MQSAPQVAAAAPKSHPRVGMPTASKTAAVQAAAAPSAAKPAAPVLKASNITMSWNNLRRQERPQKMQILPGLQGHEAARTGEKEAFRQEDLELQWMAMCNRMPQPLSGIATRMKNMNPVIKEMPAVEVVVANEIIKAEMEQIKGSIVSTLKLYLHNSDITLSLVVAKPDSREKVLTRREQFEEMVRQNPSVEKLRVMFDLELA